jgi:hypothetical protein
MLSQMIKSSFLFLCHWHPPQFLSVRTVQAGHEADEDACGSDRASPQGFRPRNDRHGEGTGLGNGWAG